jgi:hypothetical protein
MDEEEVHPMVKIHNILDKYDECDKDNQISAGEFKKFPQFSLISWSSLTTGL